MERHCPKCTLTRPLADFYKRPDGRPQGWCKACQNEDRKARYARSPEMRAKVRARSAAHYAANKEAKNAYTRAYGVLHRDRLALAGKQATLRRKYGITVEDYDAILDAQKGVCAICLGPQRHGWTYFCVDHCHTTGRVRGLLCDFCNRATGSLEDDADRAERLAAYLRR